MGQLKEYVKIAFYNIKSNKMRSLLTMLGIIIGISSVVMIVSAGNGVKKTIYDELNGILGCSIDISLDYGSDAENVYYFDNSDMKMLEEKLDNIKGVSPASAYAANTYIETAREDLKTMFLFRTEVSLYADNKGLYAGRYFTRDECDMASEVCVIEEKDAVKIFGTPNVVGTNLEVNMNGNYRNLKIVGVRNSRQDLLSTFLFGSSQILVEVPYTLKEAWLGSSSVIYAGLTVYPEDGANKEDLVVQAVRLLEGKLNIRGENMIYVSNYDAFLSEFNLVLLAITAFIMLVAAISLLVGGIGIMNIMLVSVTERTKEIGIRKALGAKTASLIFQFLMEGGVISLVGGVVGITLGLLGSSLLCAVGSAYAKLELTADYNFVVIIGAAAFSAAIGIFFTIYPARKAARLNPIDALHHE